MADYRRVDDL